MTREQPVEERDHPLLQRGLFPSAIGKAGVVGDIDEVPLRHQHARLAQHRQPADAAVEHEDRFGIIRRHGRPSVFCSGCGSAPVLPRHAALRG